MPDSLLEPLLQVSATAAEAGGVAPVPMARHAGERRWLALMIEAIKKLSAIVDAPGQERAA